MEKPSPPKSKSELLLRVEALSGMTLGEVAQQFNLAVPDDFLREKGWSGQLLEYALGASAGSKPVPDFEHLDIELKTLPISFQGKPLETTYVSVVPLTNLTGIRWEDSSVKKKLDHVLWLPILAERDIRPVDRVIGSGFLWQPSPSQAHQLRRDWEEQIELIALGKVEEISGKLGEVMQIRPKAANSQVKTQAIGPHGNLIETLPRGFYLKTTFTHSILKNAFSH